jgi:hypothetical protein
MGFDPDLDHLINQQYKENNESGFFHVYFLAGKDTKTFLPA